MTHQEIDGLPAAQVTKSRHPRPYAIIAGAIACVAIITWLLVGMPGVPLDDGGYWCGSYSADVKGGEVVRIAAIDPATPAIASWEGARRAGDHRFTVNVEDVDGFADSLECVAI
jgi:hypothetical protein